MRPREDELQGGKRLTVNTNAVNGIFFNEILYPVPVSCLDPWVLRVQVWEWDLLVAQPTVHFTLSITPNDRAIRVVLRL